MNMEKIQQLLIKNNNGDFDYLYERAFDENICAGTMPCMLVLLYYGDRKALSADRKTLSQEFIKDCNRALEIIQEECVNMRDVKMQEQDEVAQFHKSLIEKEIETGKEWYQWKLFLSAIETIRNLSSCYKDKEENK